MSALALVWTGTITLIVHNIYLCVEQASQLLSNVEIKELETQINVR